METNPAMPARAAQPKIPVPSVTKQATLAFSKVWDSRGIKVLMDGAAIEFATDWANIVLRSYFENQVKAAMAAADLMAKQQAAAAAGTPTGDPQITNVCAVPLSVEPTAKPSPSLIQLTDA